MCKYHLWSSTWLLGSLRVFHNRIGRLCIHPWSPPSPIQYTSLHWRKLDRKHSSYRPWIQGTSNWCLHIFVRRRQLP